MPETRRVNMNLSESAYATLRELAERSGKTMSAVLRDGLVLEKWIESADRTWIEWPDGTSTEIVAR